MKVQSPSFLVFTAVLFGEGFCLLLDGVDAAAAQETTVETSKKQDGGYYHESPQHRRGRNKNVPIMLRGVQPQDDKEAANLRMQEHPTPPEAIDNTLGRHLAPISFVEEVGSGVCELSGSESFGCNKGYIGLCTWHLNHYHSKCYSTKNLLNGQLKIGSPLPRRTDEWVVACGPCQCYPEVVEAIATLTAEVKKSGKNLLLGNFDCTSVTSSSTRTEPKDTTKAAKVEKYYTKNPSTDGKGSKSSRTGVPSNKPSQQPSDQPSLKPSKVPSQQPSEPSDKPSLQPSNGPSDQPSDKPSLQPSDRPSLQPSDEPSLPPSDKPSLKPSDRPSLQPSDGPSDLPSDKPSIQPSDKPSLQPSDRPSDQPSEPSDRPSLKPSKVPSQQPSDRPSLQPSDEPSLQPSEPSDRPSLKPSKVPSQQPSDRPSLQPSDEPSLQPSEPSDRPSLKPSKVPSHQPSDKPSLQPSNGPSQQPSEPSDRPSLQPSDRPSDQPSEEPCPNLFTPQADSCTPTSESCTGNSTKVRAWCNLLPDAADKCCTGVSACVFPNATIFRGACKQNFACYFGASTTSPQSITVGPHSCVGASACGSIGINNRASVVIGCGSCVGNNACLQMAQTSATSVVIGSRSCVGAGTCRGLGQSSSTSVTVTKATCTNSTCTAGAPWCGGATAPLRYQDIGGDVTCNGCDCTNTTVR